MSLAVLLAELAARRIEVRCENGKLRYKAPEGALTSELRERIAAQKAVLLAHLSGQSTPEPELLRTPPSVAQERLWFLDQLLGPNYNYNIPMALRLRGELDGRALTVALDDMVRRHQCLRASFRHDGESLYLEIARDLRAPCTELDLSSYDHATRQVRLREHADSIARHCFDLRQGPLLMASLVCLDSTQHVLLLNFHHIIADGWSFGIIMQEIAAGYEARRAGHAPALPPLRWQYSDYVAWQQQLGRSGAMDADLAFWCQRLAGAPECTTMPTDQRRRPVQDFAGATVPMHIESAMTAQLRAKARQWGAALNHLTLSALALVIAEFSGNRDLVIGVPLANRTRSELEPIVGMFVNVVPIRIAVPRDAKPSELVAQVKVAITDALEHCNLPFERLLERVVSKRDLGTHPLFQVAYNLLPPLPNQSFAGLLVDSPNVFGESPVSKYDCTFYWEERDGSLVGHVEYATSLYQRRTVERWVEVYTTVLNRMLDDTPISQGAFVRENIAGHTLLQSVCAGPLVALPEGSPWARFQAIAKVRRDETAVEEGDVSVSYAELERRAGIVASKLAALGVTKGDRVGLLLPRGCDYLAAMLGVVHRGAVFVPLDPTQPAARLGKMLNQAALGALVCRANTNHPAEPMPATIELGEPTWREQHSVPVACTIDYDDPLYMMFTSGTTGTPKAASVPWRGLCNLAQAVVRNFELTTHDRSSQISAIGFDASLFEIWPTLLSGGALVFVPEESKLNPEALRDFLLHEQVSVHFSPTPLAEQLLELDWPESAALRIMTTGGQALHKRPRPGLPFRLCNAYGPTEASVLASWSFVESNADAAGQPTIGRPLDNTRLGVFDELGQFVTPGAIGELYIAGCGVALGYWNAPEATARSFITPAAEPSVRWYRTGDNVKLRVDGELEFIGRTDQQIKLRGYRIELGEIEHALRHIANVRQAVVRLEGEHLVAYLEAHAPQPLPREVRHQLAASLPSYMLPTHIVIASELPRLSSGKLDIAAISRLRKSSAASPGNLAARTDGLKAAVTRAWVEVLGNATPGEDDNFFDLGGHSLLLVRLREHIRAQTGQEIAVLELLGHPTIAGQTAFLEGGARPQGAAVVTSIDRSGAGIAIIGMSGRFPEAADIRAFWGNLCDAHDCVRFFSRQELLDAGVPADLVDRPDYVPANAFLPDTDRFDAEFFGISPREAEIMDPQQRILLEEAWHLFEDAGYVPSKIQERVGVYVGSSLNGYLIENVLPRHDVMRSLGGFTIMIHNDKDFAATRLSYKLNLRGPSVSVNTACSTSLVAIHQAVTALRDGQCEYALAGGVCVRARQIDGYIYENEGVLSRDGKCRAFDAAASGMVGGNGVALVLLKPLERAVADQDHIYAVIKGIAINNDGSDKLGFTAPGIRGQSSVVRDALERAGVAPETVGYVEAHGTGTQLGDAIEVAALTENYVPNGVRATPLYLGSVKTNIGHLDAAAGAAGLIKAALCLRERTLVPTLHFQRPNPEIRWPGQSLSVCTQTVVWESHHMPLRAAVSSLGIGGTNAHAVLEVAPKRSLGKRAGAGGPRLLPISGRNEQALQSNALALADWLGEHPNTCLDDVAQTLASGRQHWGSRRAVCASSCIEAAELLTEPLDVTGPATSVAFLFAGMGAQKAGMACALYQRAPAFKASLDECAETLRSVLSFDIRSLLLAAPNDSAANILLQQHRLAQPSVFALEYALVKFWSELGIAPSVLLGHSLGEWTAACVAGVFALPDALRLVALRGELMDRQPEGAMLAVNLTEPELLARLPAGIDIATLNAVDEMVVAGPIAAIDAFVSELIKAQVRYKYLSMKLAAHSALMEPVCNELCAAVAKVNRGEPNPNIVVISNVTGEVLPAERLRSPDYWATHLRHAVRFVDGLGTIWKRPQLALLECGPSHTLCNIALRDPRRPNTCPVLASLDGGDEPAFEWRRALESAGQLWAAGLPIDWDRLGTLQGSGLRIPLPGYSFQRKRFWLDSVPSEPTVARSSSCVEAEQDTPVSQVSKVNSSERRVITLMQELLGSVRLSRTSDFFLHGGDSLMAIRLASRIADVFGIQPTVARLMATRTPGAIAAWLNAERPEHPADELDSCVIRLWRGEEKLSPIVLVHAVGGGIFIYRELLEALSTAHPVYGLQAPGLWDSSAPIADLREQAEHYHACLQRAGVHRPVMIAGSSYGGLVCYELDRLFGQVEHRPLVALFDSPGPGYMPARLESEAEVCAYFLARDEPDRDLKRDIEKMQGLDHQERLALLLAQMRATVMPHAEAEHVERQLRVFRQNLTNMWNWNPKPHATRLLFCRATEQSPLVARNPELAWIPLARDGIEILPVPGDHSSMLSFPHVNQLANELTRRLSERSRVHSAA